MPHVDLTTSVRPIKICKPYAVRLIGGMRCILEGCCKIRLPSDAKCRIDDSMSIVQYSYRCSARLPRDAGRSGGGSSREVRFRVIVRLRVRVLYDFHRMSTNTVRVRVQYEYRLHIRVAPFSRYCTVPVLYLYALNH